MQFKWHRRNITYCKPVQGSPQHQTDQKEDNTESDKTQVIFFLPTTVDKVKNLLNETDTKKAVDTDTIPLKLIKIGSNILASIPTTAINFSIENSVFPENAKVATFAAIR